MPDATSSYLNRHCRPLSEIAHLRSPDWPRTRRLTVSEAKTALDMRYDYKRRKDSYRSDFGLSRDGGPRSAIHRACGHLRLLRQQARNQLKAYRRTTDDRRRLDFLSTWASYKQTRVDVAEAIEIFEGHNADFLRTLPNAIARLEQWCEADELGWGEPYDRLKAYREIAETFLGTEQAREAAE